MQNKRLDALLEEHDALLGKATLTDAETRRLAELDAALDALPAGELPAEVEAMRVIREAARALRPGP